MNILLYTNSYLPTIGGREIVVHYLAREYQKLGHNVRVYGPAGWWKHRKLKFGYPLHRWPTLRGLFREKVNRFTFMLDRKIWGADIVHAHSTYPCGYIAACVLKDKKVPIVVTPHGEDIHTIPELKFGLRLKPGLAPKIDRSLDRAQLVTAISMSVKESLKDAGVVENKIRFVPNGIDTERFCKNVGGVRDWLDIDLNAPVILSVGNYHPRKGLEILIKAMPDIIKERPEAKLVLVGRTKGKLEPLVQEMDLNRSVRLTGPIPFPLSALSSMDSPNGSKDKLAGLYREADVYVSAAMEEGAEGLSLAMLDAMAAGLPLVATRISGNRDLVSDGVNGLLVKPGDSKALAQSILETINNKRTVNDFGEKNRMTAENYSWRKIANQYLDVYTEANDLIK